MKKNIKFIIIGIVILVILLALGYFLFFKDGNSSKDFGKEYNLQGENVFVYRDAEEIVKILKNGTGVVYLGFPECKWCQAYVQILNEVANEKGIDKIYYLDIQKDRQKNTKEYQEIVKLLKNRLLFDEEGKERVFVPYVAFVINGKIIDHDYETSVIEGNITPEQYWTNDQKDKLKVKLGILIDRINQESMCTDCNK